MAGPRSQCEIHSAVPEDGGHCRRRDRARCTGMDLRRAFDLPEGPKQPVIYDLEEAGHDAFIGVVECTEPMDMADLAESPLTSRCCLAGPW